VVAELFPEGNKDSGYNQTVQRLTART
jgi:hypothetical protein